MRKKKLLRKKGCATPNVTNPNQKKERGLESAPVFRYDKHMPQTDDLTLIVLKGHLLIEEVLVQLAESVLPHSEYLNDASLSFHKLACVVRAAVPERSDDVAWQLILSFNALRNDLAHKLESSKRQERLNALFKIAQQVQPVTGLTMDKSGNSTLGEPEHLRHVVIDCMEFLVGLTYDVSPPRKHAPR